MSTILSSYTDIIANIIHFNIRFKKSMVKYEGEPTNKFKLPNGMTVTVDDAHVEFIKAEGGVPDVPENEKELEGDDIFTKQEKEQIEKEARQDVAHRTSGQIEI